MERNRHAGAADRHDQAAELHQRAARFWQEKGEPDRAELERDLADHEREAAALERRREHVGEWSVPSLLGACGEGTTIHPSAVIVEPAYVRLGSDVTIEPLAVLMGYPDGELEVGDGTLIGPHAYLQGLGGLHIGPHVGVGAGVLMLTALHAESPPGAPITAAPLRYGAIEIADGCDIGVGSVLLPGTRLGSGVQVGAGAVVRGEHPAGSVIAGLPARPLRMRGEGDWASGLSSEPPRRAG